MEVTTYKKNGDEPNAARIHTFSDGWRLFGDGETLVLVDAWDRVRERKYRASFQDPHHAIALELWERLDGESEGSLSFEHDDAVAWLRALACASGGSLDRGPYRWSPRLPWEDGELALDISTGTGIKEPGG